MDCILVEKDQGLCEKIIKKFKFLRANFEFTDSHQEVSNNERD